MSDQLNMIILDGIRYRPEDAPTRDYEHIGPLGVPELQDVTLTQTAEETETPAEEAETEETETPDDKPAESEPKESSKK